MSAQTIVKTFLTLIIALVLCLVAGYIGGYPPLSRMPFGNLIDLPIENVLPGYPGLLGGETPPLPIWYDGLVRPVFSPPVWMFPPLWTIAFLLMGLTLFLIIQASTKDPDNPDIMFGLILYISQALFTILWAYAFFGLHSPFVSFMCMIALFATLLCTIIQVFKFSPTGGMLLVPYFLWVCYLAYFNYGVMVLNNYVFVLVT